MVKTLFERFHGITGKFKSSVFAEILSFQRTFNVAFDPEIYVPFGSSEKAIVLIADILGVFYFWLLVYFMYLFTCIYLFTYMICMFTLCLLLDKKSHKVSFSLVDLPIFYCTFLLLYVRQSGENPFKHVLPFRKSSLNTR